MALRDAFASAIALAMVFSVATLFMNVPTASAASAAKFNFTEFMSGQWTVEIRSVTPGTPKQEAADDDFDRDDEVTLGNYILHRKAGGYLEGVYFENITNSPSDIKNSLRVRVDCHSASAGVFKTARAETDIFEESVDDEPNLQYRTLFEFDFETHKNGMRVAHGEWHGRRKGTYQFTIASPGTFVLAVYPQAAPEKNALFTMQTMTGLKDVQKGFLETYGFQLLLVLMIFVPRFLLSGSGRRMIRQPVQQPAAPRASAAPAGKKDK